MNRKSMLYVLGVAAAAAIAVTGCGTANSTNNTSSSGAASTAVAVKHEHKGASVTDKKEAKAAKTKSSTKTAESVKSSVTLTTPAAGSSVTADATLKVDGHVSSNLAKKDVEITLTNSEKKVLVQQIVGTNRTGEFVDTLKLPKDLGKPGAELTLTVSVVGESGATSVVTLHVK